MGGTSSTRLGKAIIKIASFLYVTIPKYNDQEIRRNFFISRFHFNFPLSTALESRF
jgi:hypothetical protein